MTVLAVVSTPNSTPAPDSAPRRIVANLPSVELNVVQFERRGAEAIAYLWMSRAAEEAFESVLVDDPKVSYHNRVEQTDSGTLYKVAWEVDSPLIHCVAKTNGVVMRARGTPEEWQLNIWFENGADASAFHQCCTAGDIPISIDRLTSLGDFVSDGAKILSKSQRETLSLAYREGYFDEPRGVTQQELADQLGVSSSAVGGRLRRGTANLIKEILVG